jgi:hypothetical protein
LQEGPARADIRAMGGSDDELGFRLSTVRTGAPDDRVLFPLAFAALSYPLPCAWTR